MVGLQMQVGRLAEQVRGGQGWIVALVAAEHHGEIHGGRRQTRVRGVLWTREMEATLEGVQIGGIGYCAGSVRGGGEGDVYGPSKGMCSAQRGMM